MDIKAPLVLAFNPEINVEKGDGIYVLKFSLPDFYSEDEIMRGAVVGAGTVGEVVEGLVSGGAVLQRVGGAVKFGCGEKRVWGWGDAVPGVPAAGAG